MVKSLYSKRNVLDDYLGKSYVRLNFLKWVGEKDPDTILYMYKLLKEYSIEKNIEKEKEINKYKVIPKRKLKKKGDRPVLLT